MTRHARIDGPQFNRRAALAGLAALGLAAVAPAGAAAEPKLALGVFTLGDPEAPVHVIEYVSLTCPHCANFHVSVYPDLVRDYVDTGKARIEVREVYFDRVGLWAAMLARCGGEDRYFGMISLLLTRQSEWARADDLLGEFKKLGRQAGLSDAEVEACMADSAGQRALVEQYQTYYQDPLLTGTPTLVVQGRKVESPTFGNLSAAIDAALGS